MPISNHFGNMQLFGWRGRSRVVRGNGIGLRYKRHRTQPGAGMGESLPKPIRAFSLYTKKDQGRNPLVHGQPCLEPAVSLFDDYIPDRVAQRLF